METITTPETSQIPEAPAGVFVPNNQVPVTADTTPTPIEAPVQPVQAVASVPVVTPVVATERPLEKVFNWLAKFLAKVSWQPDPITGEPNTSKTATKAWNVVGKVRDTANQVVAKAGDVAGKAVNTVNQATEKIQQVIPPQVAPQAPVEPVPTPASVAPVVETPVVEIPQTTPPTV